jgi:hypothetical protein
MNWPPKDWRALIALLGSVAGAATLTILVAWGVSVLLPGARLWTDATEAHRAETIRWVLWIAVVTIGVIIIGLGFAINRRSFKGRLSREGASLDFEGGFEAGEGGGGGAVPPIPLPEAPIPPPPKFTSYPPPTK